MKAARQITALLAFALGAFLVWQGRRLRIEGDFGPGPGFFPFWIGIALVVLGGVWMAQLVLKPAGDAGAAFLPARDSRGRLAVVFAALVGFMLLLRPIGFNLAMLALLLVLFFAIDRKFVVAKITIAFAASFGVHWLFERKLNVPLPYASVPALQHLGL